MSKMKINQISEFCAKNISLGRHEVLLVEEVLKEMEPDFIVFYSGGGLRNEVDNDFGFVEEIIRGTITDADYRIKALENFKLDAVKWVDIQKRKNLDLNNEAIRVNLLKDVMRLFKKVTFFWFKKRRSHESNFEDVLPSLRVKVFKEVIEINGEELEFHKVSRRNVKFISELVSGLYKSKNKTVVTRLSHSCFSTKGHKWVAIPKHVDMGVGKANVFSNLRMSKQQFDSWEFTDEKWIKNESSIMKVRYLI